MLIVGPSGSGKLFFTRELLLYNLDLFEQKPQRIVYCYGSWQEGFKPMQKAGIKFFNGIPDTEILLKWFPK